MTIAMGLIANRPVALASGMGINAIVAYTLCLGGVNVDWRVAMAIVMLEGVVIFILVACGFVRRSWTLFLLACVTLLASASVFSSHLSV